MKTEKKTNIDEIKKELKEEIKEELEETSLKIGTKRIISENVIDVVLEGYNITDNKTKKLTDRIIKRVCLILEDNRKITYKPKSWINKEEITENGFIFKENKSIVGISIKDLDLKFSEILQTINKKKVCKIQVSVTPFIKSENTQDGFIETEYLTINYKDLESLEILN